MKTHQVIDVQSSAKQHSMSKNVNLAVLRDFDDVITAPKQAPPSFPQFDLSTTYFVWSNHNISRIKFHFLKRYYHANLLINHHTFINELQVLCLSHTVIGSISWQYKLVVQLEDSSVEYFLRHRKIPFGTQVMNIDNQNVSK